MKKIGELYTLTGKMPVNTPNFRVPLFDGRFDTGFRVESLEIVDSLPISQNVEFQMIVSTDELVDAVTFNFGDQTQIAWALWNSPNVYSGPKVEWVDPDNLAVEDLFLSLRGGSDNTDCNYIIKMQKYEFSEWRGALAMVRANSQGASND